MKPNKRTRKGWGIEGAVSLTGDTVKNGTEGVEENLTQSLQRGLGGRFRGAEAGQGPRPPKLCRGANPQRYSTQVLPTGPFFFHDE